MREGGSQVLLFQSVDPTPQAEAPLRRTTDEAEAVVSELAIWKM